MLINIRFSAVLAFVQVPISHPRMLVELADGPLDAALEAGFERP
jgi:hypothetical protein